MLLDKIAIFVPLVLAAIQATTVPNETETPSIASSNPPNPPNSVSRTSQFFRSFSGFMPNITFFPGAAQVATSEDNKGSKKDKVDNHEYELEEDWQDEENQYNQEAEAKMKNGNKTYNGTKEWRRQKRKKQRKEEEQRKRLSETEKNL